MKVLCLSLKHREDLRKNQDHVKEYFGDKFEFYITEKKIKTVVDIDRIIKSGLISTDYYGGRKKTSSLINEIDCFYQHYSALLQVNDEPMLIYEDGVDFDIKSFEQNKFDDSDIILCDKRWYVNENTLCGMGTNYYVTPKGAKILLELLKQSVHPFDISVRNIINFGLKKYNIQLKYSLAEPLFISRNESIPHTIQEYVSNEAPNTKQDWRPLLERLYTLKKQKIAILASHPSLGTGYANIATQIANNMVNHFEVLYLGFQSITGTVENRKVDSRVKVYDLFKLDPKSPGGFGDKAILPILIREQPDILFVYNDIGVVSAVLKITKDYTCLKTVYLDMVYEYQDFDQTKFIMEEGDLIFTFCDFWTEYLNNVYNKPDKVFTMFHGLQEFPKMELLKREYFGYGDDYFIFLNMNRNSGRKNLDICIRGFLMLLNTLKRDGEDYTKVFLQLNCHLCTRDGLHIPNVVTAEIKRHNLIDEFSKQILVPTKGHSLSELETHSLYNVSDCGVSISSGEGFGLTTIEQAIYNKPIIAPYIPTTAELLDTPYIVKSSDTRYDYGQIGGLLYCFKGEDLAQQMYAVYKARKEPVPCKIKNIEKLNWETIIKNFYEIVN